MINLDYLIFANVTMEVTNVLRKPTWLQIKAGIKQE